MMHIHLHVLSAWSVVTLLILVESSNEYMLLLKTTLLYWSFARFEFSAWITSSGVWSTLTSLFCPINCGLPFNIPVGFYKGCLCQVQGSQATSLLTGLPWTGTSLSSCAKFAASFPAASTKPNSSTPLLNLADLSLTLSISCLLLSILSLLTNIYLKSAKAWAWHCTLGYKDKWEQLLLSKRSQQSPKQRHATQPGAHCDRAPYEVLGKHSKVLGGTSWSRSFWSSTDLKLDCVLLVGAVTSPQSQESGLHPFSSTSHLHRITLPGLATGDTGHPHSSPEFKHCIGWLPPETAPQIMAVWD